uniref:Major facilitator superfamily domain containing 2a-like 2 n=1 Tax=Cynoglossus semilaevis TaxID=244447 RepID=A0A3P8WXF6_CYNSE
THTLTTAAGSLSGPASTQTSITDTSPVIPLYRKICYAVGGVPCQMTAVAIGVSLQIFLLDVVQMNASYVSMILFVSRAWDAVTDPLIGYLVSRSKQTAVGKLTPWLVLSTPLGVMSYLLLWFHPPGLMSRPLRVLWFLSTTCLFETLMSCYNVPYLSLSMFLGGDQRARDSATAYRMCAEMVAMLLASIIQGHVVSVYNTEKQEACEELHQVHHAAQSTRRAFLSSSLVVGSLFFLCSLVLFFGVKEQNGESETTDRRLIDMIVCHVPYQRLVLGFVFTALAFQMSWSNFALFCSHAAGLGAQFQYLLLALLVSASVSVPVWQVVLLRVGKRRTALIGISLYIPAVLVITCVPTNLPLFIIVCVVMGFSVATACLLPWSMLPDVVDDFAERHPSFRDLEPLFFSGYAFSSKLAGGLSAGFSTMVLQFVGYRAGACSHGDGVVTTLIVLFSGVPVALLLVAMLFFYFYPINERQRQEQPTTVKPEVTSSSPSSPSDPAESTERSTLVQWLPPGVRSSPQRNTSSTSKSKSNSSHGRNRLSVKSPAAPRGRDGGGPGVDSKTPPHCPEERVDSDRKVRPDRPRRVPGSGSRRTDMRSTGLWV